MNGQLADEFFKIDEIPRNSLDTKKKAKIFYVETFLDDIPDSFFSEVHTNKKSKHFINYTPVSEFPSSTRDFSFSIINLKKVTSLCVHDGKNKIKTVGIVHIHHILQSDIS